MDSDTSSTLRPLEYPSKASRQENQRSRRLVAVAIISLCVSLLNLAVNTGFVAAAYLVREDAEYELTSRQEEANKFAAQAGFPTPTVLPQSFAQPLQYDRAWALFAEIVFSMDYVPAVMLLIAALVLLRGHTWGIKLHKAYSVVKLVATAGGAIVILFNFGTPFTFGFIPIALAFVYPIIILSSARRWRAS